MAEKSITEQITEHEQEIEKLKAKLAEQSKLDYPKWIADPNDLTGKEGRAVNTPAEEKAVLASYEKAAGHAKKRLEIDKQIKELEEKREKIVAGESDEVKTKRAPKAAKASKAPKAKKGRR